MIISRHVLQRQPLPPFLLAAAIDYINHVRPKPDRVELNITEFALRLGYDATTAAILATRVSATARMFNDPTWHAVRHFGQGIDSADSSQFDEVVRNFISNEPLDAHLAFDPRRLLAALLRVLPDQGRA